MNLDGIGVDTIALRFDLIEPAGPGRLLLPGYGSLWAQGLRARVETSLPKRWWGHNSDPVPFRWVDDAIDQLVDEVREHVAMTDESASPARAQVRRLDLVRDFDAIEDPAATLRHLARLPQSRRMTLRVTESGCKVGTVWVGTTRHHAMIYNKASEAPETSPQGRVRFEVCMRAPTLTSVWARRNGGVIQVVADLHEQKLANLLRARFDAVRFGSPIGELDEWAAIEAMKISNREKYMLYAHVQRRRDGLAPLLSANARAKYEHLVDEMYAIKGRRLDWDRGREIDIEEPVNSHEMIEAQAC
jgi:hypothetical protein